MSENLKSSYCGDYYYLFLSTKKTMASHTSYTIADVTNYETSILDKCYFTIINLRKAFDTLGQNNLPIKLFITVYVPC